jgi:dihydroxyacetone kinase-like predicted kinase
VVAVAPGPGLAALLESVGATVVEGGAGRRPSPADLLAAMRGCGASEVVLLPNDADSLAVAEAAAAEARNAGLRVALIPTRAPVQALAALAVHDSGRGFDDDVVTMTSAARSTHHAGVTVAVREAMTTAGVCQAGDVLGLIDDDVAVIGSEVEAVAAEVLDLMLAAGGELVTLVRGAGTEELLVDRLADHVQRSRPGVEVVTYDGGQPLYPLLVGVE